MQPEARRSRRPSPLWAAIVTMLSLAIAAGVAGAENFFWVWGDGAFSEPLHWIPYDPGGGVIGPPGAFDNAIFAKSLYQSEGRISFDYSPQNAALFVNDLAEEFDLGGQTYTLWWDTGAYPFSVNVGIVAGSPASLMLMNGTVSAASSVLGCDPGWAGTVTVETGATWAHSGTLAVGLGGVGQLHVRDGGAVTCEDAGLGGFPGSVGVATVDGNGSGWTCSDELRAGIGGTGTLLVTGGGRVDSAVGNLAELAGSTGQATITGASSRWETVDLHVGGTAAAAGGAATLTVADGGHVEAAGTLKVRPGGTAVLDGGSITTHSLDNTGGGALDHRGGTLTVRGGSFAPGASLTIDGNGAPASPELVLDGATTGGSPSQITVASVRQGSMTVRGGAYLTNTGDGHIGRMPGSDGAVDVTGAGSRWINQGSLYVGGTDALPGGTGLLSVTDGGEVQVR
jgi:T5SS/PEP-CTERM-associated repeat protein